MDRSITRRAGAVLFAVLLYYVIQFPSAWAGLQNPWGAPASWHESSQWLYMTIHHVAQALLALIAIAFLGRFRFREWGLNFNNARESLRLAAKFSLWFGLFMAISLILQIATGAPPI